MNLELLEMQTRALLTYIKRVYFPYILQEPELFKEADVTCGLWVHSFPASVAAAGRPVAAGGRSERLGMVVVIGHLGLLPDALSALDSIIQKTGRSSRVRNGNQNFACAVIADAQELIQKIGWSPSVRLCNHV